MAAHLLPKDFCDDAPREILIDYFREQGADDLLSIFEDLEGTYRNLAARNNYHNQLRLLMPGGIRNPFQEFSVHSWLRSEIQAEGELRELSAEVGSIIVPPKAEDYRAFDVKKGSKIEAIQNRHLIRRQQGRAAEFDGRTWRAQRPALYSIENESARIEFRYDGGTDCPHLLLMSAKSGASPLAVVAGFRSLLEVLWNVFDELSGTVATKDEPYVQMPDKRPEFRFESVSTAWGDISRLTAYWLSLGAVRWEYLHPSRNLNGIFILSPERALELAEEGRKQGASPHPFALLKSKGIYRADVAREIRRLAADK